MGHNFLAKINLLLRVSDHFSNVYYSNEWWDLIVMLMTNPAIHHLCIDKLVADCSCKWVTIIFWMFFYNLAVANLWRAAVSRTWSCPRSGKRVSWICLRCKKMGMALPGISAGTLQNIRGKEIQLTFIFYENCY